MDRVQVTATKTPLSIGDVPGQANVVDRETIETRGDQTLTQAIANVPGVVVSTQLALFESVLLRGLPRAGNEFTNTLLLIDGVPQANSGNSARVVGLTINDASSIEVVRGPNSALYGRTAIGGSVNLRTADPTPRHQGNVEFTTGEFATLKGIGRVSGPVSNWGGYYVSVGKEQNSGYFDESDDGRLHGRQHGSLREADVQPRLALVREHQPQPGRLREQHAHQRATHRRTAPA